MRCSHCGVCCKKTEMLLSKADIELLENRGYNKEQFVRYDKDGFLRLKNYNGYCFFYDAEKHRCKIYKLRPLGCRIYPVIYGEEEGVVVDDICPFRSTVSKTELNKKGKIVIELLRRIDEEARKHAFYMKPANNLK